MTNIFFQILALTPDQISRRKRVLLLTVLTFAALC